MIRFFLGLLLTFGAVGGMEDPATPLLPLVLIAGFGLLCMYFGAIKMNRMNNQ